MIVIYGTPTCTYCDQAKKLITNMGLDYVYKDIMEDHVAMEEFTAAGNFRTVPQIFIDGKHVGGYTDLTEALAQ